MNRRTLVNLGLVAVVAALALVAWLEPGIEEAPPAPPLSDLDRDAVMQIAIHYPESERPAVVLERAGPHWRLTAPFELPANDFKVATLLDLLDARSQGELAAAEVEPARFGLAPPRAVVQYGDLEVAFGDTDPINGYRYLRLGEAIHLVSDRFFHHLNTAATGFVSYALLGPAADPVAIDLGHLRFHRTEDGWQATPATVDLATDAGSRLAQAWRSAQGVSVRRHDDPAHGGREITVTLSAGKDSVTFRVMEEDGDTLFVRPAGGVAYVVPEHLATTLLEPARPQQAAAESDAPAAGAAATGDESAGEP